MLICFLISFFFSRVLNEWSPRNIPNPHISPEKCVSSNILNEVKLIANIKTLPPSWICDPNGYLTADTYIDINNKIYEFRREKFEELSVVIVDVYLFFI